MPSHKKDKLRGSVLGNKSSSASTGLALLFFGMMQCFRAYACVVASQHPDKLKELWAYQTTIIREARRFGTNTAVLYYFSTWPSLAMGGAFWATTFTTLLGFFSPPPRNQSSSSGWLKSRYVSPSKMSNRVNVAMKVLWHQPSQTRVWSTALPILESPVVRILYIVYIHDCVLIITL